MSLIGPRSVGVAGAHRDAPGRRYIHRYAQLGTGASGIAAVGALVYLMATPQGSDRALLESCVVAAILVNALIAMVARWIVDSRWEALFFYTWSAVTMLLICVSAQLDGGAESPLTWVLVLPVVYASIDYPVGPTVVLVLGSLAATFGLMVAGNDWRGQDWFRLLFVIAFDVMAVSAAINRAYYEVAERRLATQVSRDGLTGCLNNAAFYDRLQAEEARARRTGRPFSLLMGDADGFKRINDTYGHQAGDETLQAFARILLSGARTTDSVGRIGGDEFAVLLPETATAVAAAVGGRLRALLNDTELAVPATLSLGAATWFGGQDTAAATMRRADEAMYTAKRAGGNRVAVWQPARIDLPADGGAVRQTVP
jgi:diguanylate cyclase (GGDEF)-like protein